jgi:hypothetical protein
MKYRKNNGSVIFLGNGYIIEVCVFKRQSVLSFSAFCALFRSKKEKHVLSLA